ncbi:hypothetical protein [Streptomyces sp. DW26H14]|uniref:hypothetical protein n=1 Tax=Streptomyces sp. DW26H14 TaxID=3435395 RepID=UPI00403E28A6
MSALHRAGHRLVAGHRKNVRRIGRWVTEQSNAKSSACRVAVLLACGYVLLTSAFRGPAIMWGFVVTWLFLAWRSGKGAAPREQAPVEAPETPRRAIAHWIVQLIGDRPGVHLAELYPAMRALPGMKGHDDAALRQALRELNITVTRSLRIGDVEGRSGVRLADVLALLSPDGEQPLSKGGDAGQAANSPSGERPETADSPAREEANVA